MEFKINVHTIAAICSLILALKSKKIKGISTNIRFGLHHSWCTNICFQLNRRASKPNQLWLSIIQSQQQLNQIIFIIVLQISRNSKNPHHEMRSQYQALESGPACFALRSGWRALTTMVMFGLKSASYWTQSAATAANYIYPHQIISH